MAGSGDSVALSSLCGGRLCLSWPTAGIQKAATIIAAFCMVWCRADGLPHQILDCIGRHAADNQVG